jgi:hypothetical protein
LFLRLLPQSSLQGLKHPFLFFLHFRQALTVLINGVWRNSIVCLFRHDIC